jgi:hypothetical protein
MQLTELVQIRSFWAGCRNGSTTPCRALIFIAGDVVKATGPAAYHLPSNDSSLAGQEAHDPRVERKSGDGDLDEVTRAG